MIAEDIVEDRSMRVPPGHIVCTRHIPIFSVRLACRERMAVGDVAAAFQKSLQLGHFEPFPCPVGHWGGNDFVIVDGRTNGPKIAIPNLDGSRCVCAGCRFQAALEPTGCAQAEA